MKHKSDAAGCYGSDYTAVVIAENAASHAVFLLALFVPCGVQL